MSCWSTGWTIHPATLKKHSVRLSAEERKVCAEALEKLGGSGEQARRARILLQVAGEGPGSTERTVAEVRGGPIRMVEKVRQRWPLLAGAGNAVGQRSPLVSRIDPS